MAKQCVFVLGATGRTGSSIVDGLLQSGNSDIIADVRPPSAANPEVNELKSCGVEILIIDLENLTAGQIAEQLKGVDVVISVQFPDRIPLQKLLADACKTAGVKRFVPNDWATACIRGLREMHDQKLAIHDYVKEIELGYIFIDIGWWMELLLPPTESSKFCMPEHAHRFRTHYDTGNVKSAVTDRLDIGKFVARIIADNRTLNHYVFCWTEEITQNEALALAERISGQKLDINYVSAEDVAKRAKEAEDVFERHLAEYMYSMFVRGDNAVENAKKEEYGGALDARELYPDIGKELRSLEEVAKGIYSF